MHFDKRQFEHLKYTYVWPLLNKKHIYHNKNLKNDYLLKITKFSKFYV